MFKNILACLIPLIILTFAVNFAYAGEVIVREKIRYYEVSGNSTRELRQYMKKFGPPFPPIKKDKPFWGFTHRDKIPQNKCSRIVVINYIDMPHWIGRKEASRLLRFKWDRMVRSLLKHERGHARINIEAGKEHLDARCKNAKAIKTRRKQRNAQYDKRTRHGASTGVHLNW